MTIQFIVNYFFDDFNIKQTDTKNDNSIWDNARLHCYQNLNHSKMPNINHQVSSHPTFLYWKQCNELLSLQDRFNEKVLMQFPSIPCSSYSMLMFPTNAKWIPKENDRIYPLTSVFPNEEPVEHINDSSIIIDEVSMVSPYLLDFINKIFCKLHNCILPFDGIIILLVRDLAQLPPINAPFIFKSTSWQFFIPLFLSKPKRQSEDIEFFEILQQIRFN
jgi:hypothetical protein